MLLGITICVNPVVMGNASFVPIAMWNGKTLIVYPVLPNFDFQHFIVDFQWSDHHFWRFEKASEVFWCMVWDMAILVWSNLDFCWCRHELGLPLIELPSRVDLHSWKLCLERNYRFHLASLVVLLSWDSLQSALVCRICRWVSSRYQFPGASDFAGIISSSGLLLPYTLCHAFLRFCESHGNQGSTNEQRACRFATSSSK